MQEFVLKSTGRRRIFCIHYKHLQAVFYVCKGNVRVVVQGKNLHVRVEFLEPLGDSAAYDVVWKATKGLENDESLATAACMVEDFSRYEDSLSGIESMVDEGIAALYQFRELCGRFKKRVAAGYFV